MLGSSWVAAQLTASQEGLSSMSEWVRLFIARRYTKQWLFVWPFSRLGQYFLHIVIVLGDLMAKYTSSHGNPFRYRKPYSKNMITPIITILNTLCNEVLISSNLAGRSLRTNRPWDDYFMNQQAFCPCVTLVYVSALVWMSDYNNLLI
jgi:hypothetical protein